MTQERIALVLGATGGIGSEVAWRLRGRGWSVRALHRDAARMADRTQAGLSWVQGDAMRAEDVVAAARGGALIVHAVNPPGYRNWGELVLPMLENTIAAARASGARILFPGTVYNYGPDAFANIDETSPQNPVTRKGAIRVEMERRLRIAAETGVKTLIVRAGDFFGPKVGNSWFAQGLVKPGRPVASVSYPGKRNIGHHWAYLPDVAETMVRLAEREDLAAFATFNMKGHWHGNDCGDPPRRRSAGPEGARLSVVAARDSVPVRAAVQGVARDAVPLGCAGSHEQCPPRGLGRQRAAHADR